MRSNYWKYGLHKVFGYAGDIGAMAYRKEGPDKSYNKT